MRSQCICHRPTTNYNKCWYGGKENVFQLVHIKTIGEKDTIKQDSTRGGNGSLDIWRTKKSQEK